MSHLFQLGETCVSAWRDMCLTFFSLVRHVSHLFQFLAQTLDTNCPPSIPRSFRRYLGQVTDNQCVTKICRSRSKHRIVSTNSLPSKFTITIISLISFCNLMNTFYNIYSLYYIYINALNDPKLIKIHMMLI